jgi:tetratricopeptide (TPR) repeat protein
VVPELVAVCVTAEHYRLAADYAERALSHNPRNARLRFLVAALYLSIGDRPRARDAFERSARDLPDDAAVQFAVAVFFRDEMSDPFTADVHFRDYLRLEPHGPHAEEARASLVEHVQ